MPGIGFSATRRWRELGVSTCGELIATLAPRGELDDVAAAAAVAADHEEEDEEEEEDNDDVRFGCAPRDPSRPSERASERGGGARGRDGATDAAALRAPPRAPPPPPPRAAAAAARAAFGARAAAEMLALCRGRDARPVAASGPPKTIGVEDSFWRAPLATWAQVGRSVVSRVMSCGR